MNAADDDPATDAIFKTGTLATVLQLLKLPDGTVEVLVEGQVARACASTIPRTDDFYEADAEAIADEPTDKVEAEALARSVVSRIRELCEAQREDFAGSRRRGQPDRRLCQARRYGRFASRRQDRRQAGRFSRRLGRQAAGEVPHADGERNLGPAGREAHPHARQAPDGEDPARILPQRADEGDPEGARRRGRQGRPRRDRGAHQEDQALQGGARQGDCRIEEAASDVADVGGSHRRAQLSRLALVHSVEQEAQGQEGSRPSPRRFSTASTSASTRSRSASSNISRCRAAPTS